MNRLLLGASIVSLLSAPLIGCAGQQAGPAPGSAVIDARAEDLVRAMSRFLSSQNEFGFTTETTLDRVDSTGQKLQFSRRTTVDVRRPDRIRAESLGDDWEKAYTFDGRVVSIVDRVAKVYSQTDAPNSIDQMFEQMARTYAMSVPTSDLVMSDPAAALLEPAVSGRHVGMHRVGDVPCHHLAFTQPSLDWQIWIEDGPRPVPRKLVVTYKLRDAQPQFEARFVEWKFDQNFGDAHFVFTPPAGFERIELTPVDSAVASK